MDVFDEDEYGEEGSEETLVQSFWLPNAAAVERFQRFGAENWANTEFDFLDDLTLWEYALLHGVEVALRQVRENLPLGRTLIRLLRQQLGPRKSTGRYVEAYERSGGLLNLFNPWATEADDDQWAEMKASIAHLEGKALAEAEIEIAELWNETANDLFSGLTPAHVWAGGGPEERELTEQALQRVSDHAEGPEWHTEGALLCACLMALRSWQLQPQRKLKKRSPMQVILAERERILARREEFLRQLEAEGGRVL
jgi:hypothetical protein